MMCITIILLKGIKFTLLFSLLERSKSSKKINKKKKIKGNKIVRKIKNKFKLSKLLLYAYLNLFYLSLLCYIKIKKFKSM